MRDTMIITMIDNNEKYFHHIFMVPSYIANGGWTETSTIYPFRIYHHRWLAQNNNVKCKKKTNKNESKERNDNNIEIEYRFMSSLPLSLS